MKKVGEWILHKDVLSYCAFPCMERCANGDLLVGFRRAPREENINHYHTQSRAVVIRSGDEGATWSQPVEIFPDYDLAQQDPHITLLPSGRLLAVAFTWQMHALCERDTLQDVYMEIGESKGGLMRCAGIIAALSADHGRTWRFLGKIKPEGAPRSAWVCAAEHSKAAVLPGGGILLPCRVETREGYYTYIIRSDDEGASWRYLSEAVRDRSPVHHNYYDEAYLQRTAGRLVLFLRSYDEGGLLEVCFSADDGLTWTKPKVTGVWGFPQTAAPLRDGRLLLVYGYRRPPYGVRARIVSGECDDIDTAEEFPVYEVSEEQAKGARGSTDLGYPSGIERTDGSLLIAYYCYDLNDRTSYIRGSVLHG